MPDQTDVHMHASARLEAMGAALASGDLRGTVAEHVAAWERGERAAQLSPIGDPVHHHQDVRLPDTCPPWCDVDHARYVAENYGLLTDAEIRTHTRYAGEGTLSNLTNWTQERLQRAGGSRWDLEIRQLPHPTAWNGHNGPPTIDLWTTEHKDDHDRPRTVLHLTTGEARVLAAQILAACDAVDIPVKR